MVLKRKGLFILCSLLIILNGCASAGRRELVFAVVNGEPVKESDLVYSLNIAHRREDLSNANTINILGYVRKIIDDRLIMQEARRMEIGGLPRVRKAVDEYILRESVVLLHDDEIVKKVSVTDEEMKKYYKKNYEKFMLGMIELSSEKDAKEALKRLKAGEAFKEVAQQVSEDSSKKEGGKTSIIRQAMAPDVQAAVLKLKPDEITGVISLGSKFYILKLMSRQEAPDEDFKKARDGVEKAIRDTREKERSDVYLAELRKQAAVKINRKMLAALKPDIGKKEMDAMSGDKTMLAEVNGAVLTVGEFMPTVRKLGHAPDFEKMKEGAVNGWIDYNLVNFEALRRHYEQQGDLKEMVDNYRDQLIKNEFIDKVIVPKIEVTDAMQKAYYNSHKNEFLKPREYRLRQITVGTGEEADNILNALKRGDDFAWMAKRKSLDASKEKGGDIGWVARDQLPEPVANIVDTLKPGEVGRPVKIHSGYEIVLLEGRKADETKDYDTVKDIVRRECLAAKFREIFDAYVAQLKKGGDIKINSAEIKEFEKRFRK